jgi:FRG domain
VISSLVIKSKMADFKPADDQVARCVGDLINLVRERIAEDGRILWFRGHRSANWEVVPAIWREIKYTAAQERDLTNRFSTRAATRHQALPGYDDLPTWLSLMQHYGLPTRLLDWSRSPLVAAYFAIEAYL